MTLSRRSSIEAGSPKYALILAPELFVGRTDALDEEEFAEDEDLDFESINASWTPFREMKRLTAISGPLIFQNLFGYLISVISALFVGRLGASDLAAVILANSLYNVLGFSIICGLSAGMETLCGQAFGARQYKKLGLVLQRAIFICTLACLPIILMWWNMDWVLQLMHQAEDVSVKTCRYMKIISPTLLTSMVSSVIYRYLLAQGIVQPSTLCTMVACFTCPLYNWVLIFKWNMGLDGAAYAFFLSNTTYSLCMVIYIFIRETAMMGTPESTWPGWQLKAACCDLGALYQYLSFGLPATAMICAEWWAYEAVILISGSLNSADVVVSCMGICFHVTSICYMVGYAFATATNTRIANELGLGNAVAAGRVFRVALVTVLCTQSTFAALMYWKRNELGLMFTDAQDVVAAVAHVAPVVAVSLLGDGVNAVLAGVLRGCGRQTVGAMANLVGFWCLGLPLSFVLAFRYHLEALGLWLSLATVTTLLALCMIAYVFRISWEEEVERAQQTIHKVDQDERNGGGPSAGNGVDELKVPLFSRGSEGLPCRSPRNAAGDSFEHEVQLDGNGGPPQPRSFKFGHQIPAYENTPKIIGWDSRPQCSGSRGTDSESSKKGQGAPGASGASGAAGASGASGASGV